jgi:hypothetical protein
MLAPGLKICSPLVGAGSGTASLRVVQLWLNRCLWVVQGYGFRD